MKNSVYIILFIAFSLFSVKSYAGGCAPNTTNGTCATAVSITAGGACVSGTTCGGVAPSGSSACISGAYECSWYSFVATATDMYASVDMTANDGCFNRTEVFSGSCGSLTSLSCASGAPFEDIHTLTGLTIGNTYYIQNCYSPGGPCGNGGASIQCTSAGEPDPVCDQCSAPCGTAQGFATAPTAQDVVDGCTTSPFVPELQAGSTNTFCYDFGATNTTVDFNVIITSDCGGGNVTNFSWSLYTLGCGAPIQTGTLASLTFTGLTIGTGYVFCYTFDVPAGCTHTQHCPYFVGATPLPVKLTSFTAKVIDNSIINLDWITASEINNDFFTIERSKDGFTFEVVGIVDGAGNSSMVNDYLMVDDNPYKGTSYYRLAQTDYDGTTVGSDLVAVIVESSFGGLNVYPNPVEGLGYLTFNSNSDDIAVITIYDVTGKIIVVENYGAIRGDNKIELPTTDLPQGMYFITISNDKETSNIKFIKE
jgi:hypothetical protein